MISYKVKYNSVKHNKEIRGKITYDEVFTDNTNTSRVQPRMISTLTINFKS